MRNDHYPENSLERLLNTDLITPATKKVLQERLLRKNTTVPSFFDEGLFSTVVSVSECLLPQTGRENKIDLAGMLDERLSKGKGNGWRYDRMPTDEQAYQQGIAGINETANILHNTNFIQLEKKLQDDLLYLIQSGKAPGKTWEKLPAEIFFSELLTDLVELYYSHPYAKDGIGDVSYADAKGWQKTGLNEMELFQPLPKKIGS